jgi:predicted  nucleic acid-binding Zn-ribbon protein
MKNREGYFVSDTTRECTLCGVLFPKTSKTVTLCNDCNSKRVKDEPLNKKMWRRAKSRAGVNKMDFDIEFSDVVVPTHCPVFNIELIMHKGSPGGKPNSPALDRIDNSKGYVKGNVQVISHLANMMKASATIDELQLFAKWINQTYPE